MAQILTQDHRIGQLSTPLGKDVLVIVRFDGTEALSELFEYRIEALSEEADINFDKAIGQPCTLKFKFYGNVREFSGILVEAQWLGVKGAYYSYRIVLRPWLWLLDPDHRLPDIPGQESAGDHQRSLHGSRVHGLSNPSSRTRVHIRSWNTASNIERPISIS